MNAGALQYQARTNRAGGFFLCALAATAALFFQQTDDADARGGSPRLDRGERALVRAINDVRTEHGLPRLRPRRGLNRSADAHTRDMLRANFFGHASSNGQSMESRVRRYDPARTLGETLGYVPADQRGRRAAAIVQMWMNSSGHRATLLSPRFRRIGVGRRTGAIGGMRAAVYTADFASAK